MKTFTARNGVVVKVGTGGNLFIEPSEPALGVTHVPGDRKIDALREFFLAERDEKLDLWRHEDYPEFSVKYNAKKNIAVVHYEPGNGSSEWTMDEARRINEDSMRTPGYVARLFFEQFVHPDRPWQGAEAGDLWVLTLDDGEKRSAAVRKNIQTGVLQFVGEGISTLNLKDHHIVDGIRLYRVSKKA